MTFPTDKEVEFFSQPEVADFFRRVWEPRFGDCVFNNRLGVDILPKAWGALAEGDVWLPRPDQLIEMLEEKGYDWAVERNTIVLEPGYVVMTWYVDDPDQKRGEYEGPTPAITLAKCVMEIG